MKQQNIFCKLTCITTVISAVKQICIERVQFLAVVAATGKERETILVIVTIPIAKCAGCLVSATAAVSSQAVGSCAR